MGPFTNTDYLAQDYLQGHTNDKMESFKYHTYLAQGYLQILTYLAQDYLQKQTYLAQNYL